jgi:peptidoglycan/xylan/chitin deacetylase (PgdA/CDA1 family)
MPQPSAGRLPGELLVEYHSTAENGKPSNPISIALQGKGLPGMVSRIREITGRYGVTPRKIDQSIAHYVQILNHFGSGGSFPVPGIILARNHLPSTRSEEKNIEFAMHGFHHVDHTRLSFETQVEAIKLGLQTFQKWGLTCTGFRSPYLRASNDTLAALRLCGFLYDSSQGIAWDVLNEAQPDDYKHVLEFYRAISAGQYPSLPRLEDGLVRIPYSLPDDEAFINRLHYADPETRTQVWLSILEETYRLGELFVLGLHPERIHTCEASLIKTLAAAQNRTPAIWVARLDEIARWWKARLEAKVIVEVIQDGRYQIDVQGPEGVVVLMRGVQVDLPTAPWDAATQVASGASVKVRAPVRPFIGVAQGSAPDLSAFLKQQGYIVEEGGLPEDYGYFLDRRSFTSKDERSILQEIEEGVFPLVRMGRWPAGARSALAISGDI